MFSNNCFLAIFTRSLLKRFFKRTKECTKNSFTLALQVSVIPLDGIIVKIEKSEKTRVFSSLIAFSSSPTPSPFTRKARSYNMTLDAFNPIKTALTPP